MERITERPITFNILSVFVHSQIGVKVLIKKSVNSYRKNKIVELAELYPSLKYLGADQYQPGYTYKLLRIVRETVRLSVKPKLITDTYILQPTTFNILSVFVQSNRYELVNLFINLFDC